MPDEVLSGHAGQPHHLARLRSRLSGLFGRLLRTGGASGEQQGGGEDQTTHGETMPWPRARGKVAAIPMHG